MTPSFELCLIALSIGASAFGGMLGMASGIFIVPALTVFGHGISASRSARASSP